MKRQTGVDREGAHELDRKAGVVLSAYRLRHGRIKHEIGSARNVERTEAERLVHRDERLTEPRDAGLVAEALRQRLTEGDAAVLDRVVAVHL